MAVARHALTLRSKVKVTQLSNVLNTGVGRPYMHVDIGLVFWFICFYACRHPVELDFNQAESCTRCVLDIIRQTVMLLGLHSPFVEQ